MGNKVKKLPKGGARRSNAIGAVSTTSKAVRHNNAISALLCFTCGTCFVLSLICTCLTTLVILLDQTVEAASYRNDSNRPEAYTAMESFRLPEKVKPIHYDLLLHPNLEEGTFSGKVTILLDILDKRRTIALHQKDLNITSANLITHGREKDYEIKISSVSKPTKYEIFVISAENELNSGLYNLSLEFDGNLENKIIGFYSSKYQSFRNETRYIATTKFEPTYARQAFPCFDEPSFKAQFTVKLVHTTGDCYGALSNMPITHTSRDDSTGLTTVSFAKTVPMSTYLACFIVSDLTSQTRMANGLKDRQFPVSVYITGIQPKERGYLALDIGVQVIEYYINLFKIDYPLPKLDMAAIPDFVSGAMENWGLVTYREARLLYDDHSNSIFDKRDVINVICHELAHMWFGNLVTLSWWNDLWLNEGFATFMSYKSANDILPNQGFMEQFIVDVMQKVFVTDAKLSSHPIIHNVENPDEITSFFDEISYSKGASIIRMMENFIGSDIFYGAISTYLNKYAYLNAKTADLFNILQDAVGKKLNITDIMDTWMRQEGFPVIHVKKSKNNYVLTQKRFLADPDTDFVLSNSDYGYRWTVPINFITNDNEHPTLIWFRKEDTEVTVEIQNNTRWAKFNADQIGYYRVNYCLEGWEIFKNLLQTHHTRLSTSDRANLLDDAFSLAEAGELDYSIPLNISAYLSQEYHAIPWTVARSKLSTMYILLTSANQSNMIASQFQMYGRNLVKTIYKDVSWTVDDIIEDNVPFTHLDKRVRVEVLQFACTMDYRECLEEAGRLYKEWLNEGKPVHPDIRKLVYYYGTRHVSNKDDWLRMFAVFKSTVNSSEKNKLMQGLAGTRSIEILKEYITLATDEKNVRTQDFLTCLILISTNPDGTSLVWDWVRDNWEFLVDRYTLNDRYLGQLISMISKSFATQTKLDEMKAFFEKYPEAGAGAGNRAKALETVSKNIKWLAKNTKIIEDWLNTQSIGIISSDNSLQ